MNSSPARDPYLETHRVPVDKSEFRGIFANAARAREVLSGYPGQTQARQITR